MFDDRQTEKTRKVVSYAGQEAQHLGHPCIGTEHLLLGILREGTGMAATVLNRMGLQAKAVRREVEKASPPGPQLVRLDRVYPLGQDAKKAFEYAAEEATRLGQNYLGTEDLLMGLLRVREGVGARVLESLGVELESVREATAAILSSGPAAVLPSPERIQARRQEAEQLVAAHADDPLIQSFRVVLAYYCDQETDALARKDYASGAAWHDLYDCTMKAFRALCDGQSQPGATA